MEVLSLVELLKETGISIGAFALCAWMVIFIVKRLAGSIDKVVARIENHNDTSKERSKYVREEHIKMIDRLDGLNTEHKIVAEQHVTMLASMKEVEKALGRINGYTNGPPIAQTNK